MLEGLDIGSFTWQRAWASSKDILIGDVDEKILFADPNLQTRGRPMLNLWFHRLQFVVLSM